MDTLLAQLIRELKMSHRTWTWYAKQKGECVVLKEMKTSRRSCEVGVWRVASSMVGVQGQWSLVEVVVTNFNGGSMLSICDYGGFGGGWHYLMDDEFQLWMSFSLKLLSKLMGWRCKMSYMLIVILTLWWVDMGLIHWDLWCLKTK